VFIWALNPFICTSCDGTWLFLSFLEFYSMKSDIGYSFSKIMKNSNFLRKSSSNSIMKMVEVMLVVKSLSYRLYLLLVLISSSTPFSLSSHIISIYVWLDDFTYTILFFVLPQQLSPKSSFLYPL
jgi:hypothetical protein